MMDHFLDARKMIIETANFELNDAVANQLDLFCYGSLIARRLKSETDR